MISDFVRVVVKNLEDARGSRVAALVSGGLDLGGYKNACGEIHGLDIAIAEIKAVHEKAEYNDDADD